jgi:hypothetical protein
MVLPIEQRDVAIDVNEPAPDPMDQFAELDARNSQKRHVLAELLPRRGTRLDFSPSC